MKTTLADRHDDRRLSLLQTQVRHLSNELRLTRDEYEASLASYFEIFSNMERQVQDRTRDVKNLKKVLELKGRELQIMLDSAPGMIFYKDTQQRYVRVNWKFAEVLGVSIHTVAGKTHGELFPDGTAEILAEDREVIETGKPVLSRTGIIETVQGQMPVLVNKIPYKDIDGNVIGLVGFTTDLTELRRAEEEKEHLLSRIARAEKMESIGTLAGGIAHDFNNLLFAIQGNVSLLRLGAGGDSESTARLDKILDLVNSGADLTRQLLGFARAGKYEVAATDLNQTVQTLLKMFARTRKDLIVHEEYASEHSLAEVDRSQIEQVLLNIFVNASHAMPDGGDLFVSTRNEVLDGEQTGIEGTAARSFVEIRIRDTGVGMDKATQSRIFEPFFTTKERGRGTGLGLASAYGIVRSHHGSIRVKSRPGCGSTFCIYLPVSEHQECRQPPLQDESLVKGSGKILLVDDEALVREVAAEMLKQIGYGVVAAKDGKEALETYEKKKEDFDMVILDMILPQMSGGEIYKALKAMNPEVRVLLASGYSLDRQANEIMAQGCSGFIQKPFDMAMLSRKIREVLDPA